MFFPTFNVKSYFIVNVDKFLTINSVTHSFFADSSGWSVGYKSLQLTFFPIILIAGIVLQIFQLKKDTAEVVSGFDYSTAVPESSKIGLRMTMTIIPIIGLLVAILWFKKHYILNDAKLEEINNEIAEKKLK